MKINPSSGALGARIENVDLAQPVSEGDFKLILRALGEHGVLCFPEQTLGDDAICPLRALFGELEINVANQFHEPGLPEVMVLSNMKPDGKPVGLGDAGQGWHTDMSYSPEIALANVLHAIKVPMRDGRPLGDTQFRNMHAAYDDLRPTSRTRLAGRTATHDFAKFWDMMRVRPGSRRARSRRSSAPRSRRCRSRSSGPTRSRAAPCSIAIRAMPCASMECRKPKARSCCNSCSSTRSRRNISTRTNGARATC